MLVEHEKCFSRVSRAMHRQYLNCCFCARLSFFLAFCLSGTSPSLSLSLSGSLLRLANMYSHNKYYNEAMQLFSRVLQMAPGSPQILYGIGVTHFRYAV